MCCFLKGFYEKRFSEKGITGDSLEMVWLVDNIICELNIKKDDRVLDVGCGDGYILEKVHDKVDMKGYGIDLSTKAIKITKIFAGCRNRDLEFILGVAEHIPFPDKFFDKVICSEIIEHVTDDSKFLKELHRVLRPRGLVYVTFPNKKTFFLFRPYCNTVDKIEGHLRRYEFNRIEGLLKKTGFRTVRVRFMGHFFRWLVRQFVTYNILIKTILKKRYIQEKADNERQCIVRPEYLSGFLPMLYNLIFMSDLKINRKDCLGFYVILQKSERALY